MPISAESARAKLFGTCALAAPLADTALFVCHDPGAQTAAAPVQSVYQALIPDRRLSGLTRYCRWRSCCLRSCAYRETPVSTMHWWKLLYFS